MTTRMTRAAKSMTEHPRASAFDRTKMQPKWKTKRKMEAATTWAVEEKATAIAKWASPLGIIFVWETPMAKWLRLSSRGQAEERTEKMRSQAEGETRIEPAKETKREAGLPPLLALCLD